MRVFHLLIVRFTVFGLIIYCCGCNTKKIVKADEPALSFKSEPTNVIKPPETNSPFYIDCLSSMPNRKVVSSDTIVNAHANTLTVYKIDKNKKKISTTLITDTKSESGFDPKNIADARFVTTYYDTTGRVIAETISSNNVTFHCYSYRYNTDGKIIHKEGYSSGEMGVKIDYEYDEFGKVMKETTQRPGSTSIKNY